MIPLALLDRINELKRVPRTGWLLAGIRMPESVADHTCATALVALLLAESINRNPASHGLEKPLDVGKVAQLALLHDFAECVLTDLPQRATEVLTKSVKHQAEAQVMETLFGEVAHASSVLDTWHEYRAAESPEAALVHDADKLDLVAQALAYEQQGQRNLDDYWENLAWNYEMCADLFRRLCEQRRPEAVTG